MRVKYTIKIYAYIKFVKNVLSLGYVFISINEKIKNCLDILSNGTSQKGLVYICFNNYSNKTLADNYLELNLILFAVTE